MIASNNSVVSIACYIAAGILALVLAWLWLWMCSKRHTHPGNQRERFTDAATTAQAPVTVHQETTPKYDALVIDTRDPRLGRCLLMDGRVQVCEKDEHRRHETLVHLAAQYLVDQAPKHVLIVGGGDCMALREVLKYPEVERVVVVDDDEHVRAIAEQHLGANAHRSNPRVSWLMLSPLEGVKRQDAASFDLILIDYKDRPGKSAVLAQPELYREARLRLKHHGVLVVANVLQRPLLKSLFMSTVIVTFQSDTTEQIERAILGADFDLHKHRVNEHALTRHGVQTRYYKPAQHHAHIPWAAAVDKVATTILSSARRLHA